MKLVNKILVCSVLSFGKICGQKIKAKDTTKTSDKKHLTLTPPSDHINDCLTDTTAPTDVQQNSKETKEKKS